MVRFSWALSPGPLAPGPLASGLWPLTAGSRPRPTMKLALSLLMIGMPTALAAQEPPPTWSGQAELSLVSTSGNTDTRTLGAGAEIEYAPGRWSALAKVTFIESEADDEVNARSFTALLQASRRVSARLQVYGKAGYLKDTFAGIDDRFSSEGGLGYDLFTQAPHSLGTQLGFGFTREVRLLSESLSLATGNAAIQYRWTLSETSALTDETSFTADLGNASDWRFTNDVALIAGLNAIFSLKLSQKLSYLNDPVPGFRKRDIVVSAAFVANF